MKNVGQKIIELRKLYNMSQEKLAELMDVTRQTVSKWEVYSIKPSTENILTLCKLFNVSSEYFLNDKYDDPEDVQSETSELSRALSSDKVIDISDGEIEQLNYINSLPYSNIEIAVSTEQPKPKKRHKILWFLFWILTANIFVFGAIIGVCMFIINYGDNDDTVISIIEYNLPLLTFAVVALFFIICAIVSIIFYYVDKKRAKCEQKPVEKCRKI